MTTRKKIARRELSLPELALEFQNVSKARRIMGYSRQQLYEIRRNLLWIVEREIVWPVVTIAGLHIVWVRLDDSFSISSTRFRISSTLAFTSAIICLNLSSPRRFSRSGSIAAHR